MIKKLDEKAYKDAVSSGKIRRGQALRGAKKAPEKKEAKPKKEAPKSDEIMRAAEKVERALLKLADKPSIQQVAKETPPRPKQWEFTIKRSDQGYIQSVIAREIRK